MSAVPAVIVLTPDQLRELVEGAVRAALADGPRAAPAVDRAPAGYMKIARAVKHFDLDESTIREFIRTGQLGRYKGGKRHYLVKVAELDALVARLGRGGKDEPVDLAVARSIFNRTAARK